MTIPIIKHRLVKVPVIAIDINASSQTNTFTETLYVTNMENTLVEREQDVVFGTGKIKVKSLDFAKVGLSETPQIVGGSNIPLVLTRENTYTTILFRQHIEGLLKKRYPRYRVEFKVSTNVETIQAYNNTVPLYNFVQVAVSDDPNNLYVQIYDIPTHSGRMLCGYSEFEEFAESIGVDSKCALIQLAYYYRLLDAETTRRRIQNDINNFGTSKLKNSMREFAGKDVDNIQIVTAGVCIQLSETYNLSVELAGNATIPITFVIDELNEQITNDVEIPFDIASTDEVTPEIKVWSRNNKLVQRS